MKIKSKKRALSIALSMAMVVSVCSTVTFATDENVGTGDGTDVYLSGETGNGTDGTAGDVSLAWVEEEGFYFDEATGTIIRPVDKSATSITIPATINGVAVQEIGDYAFNGCTNLESVTIEDGVETISTGAFNACRKLTSITIPGSVQTIGDYAFQYCDSLADVTIEAGVETIGYGAFVYCYNLESVTIPGSVKALDGATFAFCEKLEAVTIPDGVETIGELTFEGCTSLESITIPDSVKTIDKYAFYGCTALESVTIPEGVETIGSYAFVQCSALANVEISGNVKTIDEGAFAYCSSLTNVTIPEGVETIGENAFRICTSLASITIPASVTTVGDNAFAECDSLTDIYIEQAKDSISSASWGMTDGTVIHWMGQMPEIKYDTENNTLTGFETGETYTVTVDGNEVTLGGDGAQFTENGTFTIMDAWYGKTISIVRKAGNLYTGDSTAQQLEIPGKAEAPAGLGTTDVSEAGASDGTITGVSAAMEYRAKDAAIWTPCTGETVTGLSAGMYEIRIMSVNGKSFASDAAEVTIGTKEPALDPYVDDADDDGDSDDDDVYSIKPGTNNGNTGGSTTTPANPTTPVDPAPTTPVTPVTPVTPSTPAAGTDTANAGTVNQGSTDNGSSNGQAATTGTAGTSESVTSSGSNGGHTSYVNFASASSSRRPAAQTGNDGADTAVTDNEETEDIAADGQNEEIADDTTTVDDDETPLAGGMITDDAALDTQAADSCMSHGIGLGITLIGLIAAVLLARKNHKYFWAPALAAIAISLIASAMGTCSLDWAFFAGEVVVTIAATAALWMKQKSAKEQ